MNTTTQNNNGITIEAFNGFAIGVRQTDTYIDGTALCRANRKLIGHWLENRQTQEFLEELSRSVGIPIDPAGIPIDPSAKPIDRDGVGLIFHVMTGPNEQRGTFVHPRVAIHLAQWASPKCAVWVTDLVYRYMSGETLNAKQDQAKDPQSLFWSNMDRLIQCGVTPDTAVQTAVKLMGAPIRASEPAADIDSSVQLREEFNAIAPAHGVTMGYSDLRTKIASELHLSIATAARRIRRWVSMGLLTKSLRGYSNGFLR